MAAIIDYRGKSLEKTTLGVPLVTAKIVKGGRIEKPEEFIAEADFDDWMRRGMPKPGDIVMTTEAPLGEVALTAVPMAMNQSCYGVRGITGYGNYYSLREATAQLQQRTHGTVFDTITTETFKTLDCIFPTPKITAAFDKLVEPLLCQIRANLHQSRTLATLRDTLLPKLLSGELSVATDSVIRDSEITAAVESKKSTASLRRRGFAL